MFRKEVTQKIILLLLWPHLVFGLSIGDRVTILRETHPYYGQTGTVLNVTDTGASLDYDGDGVRELEGGIALYSQGESWIISNIEEWPKERKRFFIRFLTTKDPAGGDIGFLVVLDVQMTWFNENQMQFQVSDPQIFKSKIQTSYIYSEQGPPYADTIYKLKKINMFPLLNTLDHPKEYLNSISADRNNQSQYTGIIGNEANYTFKYHIHVTWDIIASNQGGSVPSTYTKYITDEINLTSTYN